MRCKWNSWQIDRSTEAIQWDGKRLQTFIHGLQSERDGFQSSLAKATQKISALVRRVACKDQKLCKAREMIVRRCSHTPIPANFNDLDGVPENDSDIVSFSLSFSLPRSSFTSQDCEGCIKLTAVVRTLHTELTDTNLYLELRTEQAVDQFMTRTNEAEEKAGEKVKEAAERVTSVESKMDKLKESHQRTFRKRGEEHRKRVGELEMKITNDRSVAKKKVLAAREQRDDLLDKEKVRLKTLMHDYNKLCARANHGETQHNEMVEVIDQLKSQIRSLGVNPYSRCAFKCPNQALQVLTLIMTNTVAHVSTSLPSFLTRVSHSLSHAGSERHCRRGDQYDQPHGRDQRPLVRGRYQAPKELGHRSGEAVWRGPQQAQRG